MGYGSLLHGSRRALLGKKSAVAFAVAMLFAAGEQGAHFEVYDANALYPRRNRYLWTEDFTNAAWLKSNSSIAAAGAAVTAPDGSQSAWVLTEGAVSGLHYLGQITTNNAGVPTAPGNTYTMTWVLKMKNRQWVSLDISDSADHHTYFDLLNGVVGINAAGNSASMTALGSGWYACSVSRTVDNANTNFLIAPASANGTVAYAGDGTSGTYIWHPQVEVGATFSGYQKVTDWNTEYLAAVGASNVFMWQDSAGTVPVTGIEQPVGKWVDRSGRGNHATQATSSQRPVLSARYNLLIKSEQFNDTTGWLKDNGTNASTVVNNKFIPNNGANAAYLDSNEVGTLSGVTYRAVWRVAPAGFNFAQFAGDSISGRIPGLAIVNLTNGTVVSASGGAVVSTAAVGDGTGAYDITITFPASTTAGARPFIRPYVTGTTPATGDGVSGIQLYHADFRSADDAAKSLPAYQRVNTSTDYDTAGFPFYLKFDGIDDNLVTPSINFSTFNKMTVWAGLQRQKDASAGMAIEVTANTSTTDGGFYVAGPDRAAANYGFAFRGTTGVSGGQITTVAAPLSELLTAQFDAAGGTQAAQIQARMNGVATAITFDAGSPTGAGNFANAPMYIGRRAGSSLPFTGRIHSVTARASTTPASQKFIQQMEQYAAKIAGLSFVST